MRIYWMCIMLILMQNGWLSPRQAFKICQRWLLPCIIRQEVPAFVGKTTLPRGIRSCNPGSPEGAVSPALSIWTTEKELVHIELNFLITVPWQEDMTQKKGQRYSMWSLCSRNRLGPVPGIGCTSDVKHTLFMLLDWRAFRLKTAVPRVILCIALGEDLVAPWCKGTFRWELRWYFMVPCLMRAGPHYKSQFGKGILCFQGVLCSPQSWHLFSLLPVVVLRWIDRLSCVSVNVLCRSNTFCFRRFTAVATSAALTPKIQRCLCP